MYSFLVLVVVVGVRESPRRARFFAGLSTYPLVNILLFPPPRLPLQRRQQKLQLQGDSELRVAHWDAALTAAYEAAAIHESSPRVRVLSAVDILDGLGGLGGGAGVPQDLLDAVWANLDDVSSWLERAKATRSNSRSFALDYPASRSRSPFSSVSISLLVIPFFLKFFFFCRAAWPSFPG